MSSQGRPLRRLRTVIAAAFAVALVSSSLTASEALRVSDNGRFLVWASGRPFFYLGDAAYFLLFNLTAEEAQRYLEDRAAKGFTVVEAGLTRGMPQASNVYGETTFLPQSDNPRQDDLLRPNEAFFRHVDRVVDAAEALGLHVALAAVWDKRQKDLDEHSGPAYGEFLGRRYRGKPVIWILSADSDPRGDQQRLRDLAHGLERGHSGTQLMTLKPRGGASSSRAFHGDAWLDFNMIQGSHARFRPEGSARSQLVARDYALSPAKPTLDSESGFENIPEGLSQRGKRSMWEPVPTAERLTQHDVRRAAYWTVLAGACGFTYGANGVYQFTKPALDDSRRWDPGMIWEQALQLPAASQMRYLRGLLESRPYLVRVPDQALIASPNGEREERIQAARASDGSYAFVYSAFGRPFALRMDKMAGPVEATWYDPATGEVRPAGRFPNAGVREFQPPKKPLGDDWVLVLDELARNFPPPGQCLENHAHQPNETRSSKLGR